MKKIIAILMTILLVCGMCCCEAAAEEKVKSNEMQLTAKSVTLMEAKTGTIIYENNCDEKLSPASITKIMTLILIFDALEEGKISMDDMVTTSANAKSMGGSQVFLEEGEQQDVETMIKCIVIASGNDASVAMAEFIAGTEGEFINMMNNRAAELGMVNTHFEDCSGLSDSDNHYTSAKDVAIMSRELITKYPKIFEYSTIWMEPIIHKTDKGESEFMLSNTNKLLKTNSMVKGLKTGSTSKAKYCVSTVAEKNGVELIAVVMAAADYKIRFAESESMLNYGFAKCKFYTDNKDYDFDVIVNNGEKEKVKCKNMQKFSYVDVSGKNLDKIKVKKEINKNMSAPVKKNDIVGKCVYYLENEKIGHQDIVATESVGKATYGFNFGKLVKMLFQIQY